MSGNELSGFLVLREGGFRVLDSGQTALHAQSAVFVHNPQSERLTMTMPAIETVIVSCRDD